MRHFRSVLGAIAAAMALVWFVALPHKYTLRYLQAERDPNLNRQLDAEFGHQLRKAGVLSISAPNGYLSTSGTVTYRDASGRRTTTVDFGSHNAVPDAWLDMDERLSYAGVTEGKLPDEDHYQKARAMITLSLLAVEHSRAADQRIADKM